MFEPGELVNIVADCVWLFNGLAEVVEVEYFKDRTILHCQLLAMHHDAWRNGQVWCFDADWVEKI